MHYFNKEALFSIAVLCISQFMLGCYRQPALTANSEPVIELREEVLEAIKGVDVDNYYPFSGEGGRESQRLEQERAIEKAIQFAILGSVGSGVRVLEIGTGTGYQAAVFSALGAKVYSIEIVPESAAFAEKALAQAGVSGVSIRVGDGWKGWPEEAPFDAIIVRASSPKIPEELLRQLANRGTLVVPIEFEHATKLLIIERDGNDLITQVQGESEFSKLSGAVRTQASNDPKTLSEYSLIRRLLQGSLE